MPKKVKFTLKDYIKFDNFFTRFDTIDEGVASICHFLNCSKPCIYTWRSKKKVPVKKYLLLKEHFKF